MNRYQNDRNRVERQIPGCLGRMVNLFDLNTAVGGNRLLTDRPHYEVSPVSRSQSDVSRSRVADESMNDKIVPDLRNCSSNRKLNGTPIKMLIAHEMSKEEGRKQSSSSNLVAKLMGLEDLPQRQQLSSASCRSHSGRSRSHSGSLDFTQREHGFLDTEHGECKDVFEIWQQSCKTYGGSPQKGRFNESKNEKDMNLVRETFMEAKRLSTDEKLRQSKQFQDALEVLSSKRDVFLKFLQEPNSLFSKHHHLPSVPPPPPPDSRRITVLRPSKLVDSHKLTGSVKKNRKQINKNGQMDHCNTWDKSTSGVVQPPNGNPTPPTRIVVLKPSSGDPHQMKVAGSPPSSLRTSNDDGFYADPEDSEAPESIEVPKESTCDMSETPRGHRRDETLLSPVFSNGYIGDESSFSKSEIYYAAGNLSDSEVMSPTSRHSWDYINRFDSPYSSSFSRASYSPESSVCREAKKRLSERWAMMALNGSVQEQRHVRRSSSTLGEMLALSDSKKLAESDEQHKSRERSKGYTSCSTSDLNNGQDADDSPKNLVHSKSVPVSATASDLRFNEVPEFSKSKKEETKDLTKEKSLKSLSFKGKVSSLFFSKSRKSSKQKSRNTDDEHQSSRDIGNDGSQCSNGTVVEDVPGPSQGGFSVTKLETPGNANENLDQPSPISVLDLQFEDDDNTSGYSGNAKLNEHGGDRIKYSLIDKSPLIGSIARTLSWDEPVVGPVTPVHGKTSTAPLSPEEEEQEFFLYVQMLLSAAGIDRDVQSALFSTRWHSPESPLDPSLREKYMNQTNKESQAISHSKQRHQRSFQKLVFDSVNEALMGGTQKDITLMDHVWNRMKEWISGEERCVWDGGDEDDVAIVVENVVRKEVVRQVWAEHLRLQIDNIKLEIEDKLVEELVEESVLELTGRVILAYTP